MVTNVGITDIILENNYTEDQFNRKEKFSLHRHTGCSLNIVFFPLNFVIFLNSASSAAALVFYLPGVCVHNDTEGKQRNARVGNIFKNSEKNTIFNEHPVYYCYN